MSGQFQLWLGASLVVVATLGFFWFAFDRLSTPRRNRQEKAEAVLNDRDTSVEEREAFLARVRSGIESTAGQQLEDRKFGMQLRELLEHSGSRLRPGEWVVATGSVAAVFGLVALMFRGVIVGAVAATLAVFASWFWFVRKRAKRRSEFADQLPDNLQLISVSLRSGMSLPQSVDVVAKEAARPSRDEFRRVIAETRIGRDLTDAFRSVAHRTASEDLEWVVSAIDINRTVGGDLGLILTRVESTIRARNRVRGQVQAMSAEGRMSGIVLVALPPLLLVLISFFNAEYIEPLLSTGGGWLMLALAGGMLAVGWIWLARLARFVF